MASTLMTPRRSLGRSRYAPGSGLHTASTPNLHGLYKTSASPVPPVPTINLRPPGALGRKSSLNALTSTSLATIPDATDAYALSTVLDEDTHSRSTMTSRPDAEIDVGELVDVPGGMHGTVKFVGVVQGKKGVFAGVELSNEFAARGKNSGDVDGVSYFTTTVAGAGIFLPLNRATRRRSNPTSNGSYPMTPTTPSLTNFKASGIGRRDSTPPTPSIPKFSQSVGPARAMSPQLKKPRPSLPRPESPIRRQQTPLSRAATTTPGPKAGGRYATPTPNRFAQSVRGTRDAGDPTKKFGLTPKTNPSTSIGPRSASALSELPPPPFSDDESTPIGIARTTDNGSSIGSVASFNAKIRPSKAYEEEIERLKTQLEDRDQQLRDQASSLAEMESSLGELQMLMTGAEPPRSNRGSMDDKDATQLRAMLREKNDKIATLTAEFDAHRADFRSTIDTLEMASSETERVYERRVEDLLQEIRDLQERNEDVDSVAQQLKQLEELVQELEEGLEDARRDEAEARGEVEFLRGEVERGRAELRREREKAAEGPNEDVKALAEQVEQRDDEIRGLKAIIHSLSRDGPDAERTPARGSRQFNLPSGDGNPDRQRLEREINDLRSTVEKSLKREEELEKEIESMRRRSASTQNRSSAITIGSGGTLTQDRTSRDSRGSTQSWRDRDPAHRRKNTLESMREALRESDANSSVTEEGSLWCEMCETNGHDILSCTNMFGDQAGQTPKPLDPAPTPRTGKDVVMKALAPQTADDAKPAPLSPSKKANGPATSPVAILPNPMDQGPIAGKETGVVDMAKWCALCERDGHESVDCPFEDAF